MNINGMYIVALCGAIGVTANGQESPAASPVPPTDEIVGRIQTKLRKGEISFGSLQAEVNAMEALRLQVGDSEVGARLAFLQYLLYADVFEDRAKSAELRRMLVEKHRGFVEHELAAEASLVSARRRPATAATAPPPQPVKLADVAGPANTFKDAAFGLSLEYPAGWKLLSGARWGAGNSGNTFHLRPLWPSKAKPAIYYEKHAAGSRSADMEAWFRESARRKAEARKLTFHDYRNIEESIVLETSAKGYPMSHYMAHFSAGMQPMAEYFVTVAGESVHVMFFTQGKREDVEALIAEQKQMANTVTFH